MQVSKYASQQVSKAALQGLDMGGSLSRLKITIKAHQLAGASWLRVLTLAGSFRMALLELVLQFLHWNVHPISRTTIWCDQVEPAAYTRRPGLPAQKSHRPFLNHAAGPEPGPGPRFEAGWDPYRELQFHTDLLARSAPKHGHNVEPVPVPGPSDRREYEARDVASPADILNRFDFRCLASGQCDEDQRRHRRTSSRHGFSLLV